MSNVIEKQLYKPITNWLKTYLSSKYKKSNVLVWDSHSVLLSKLLQQTGYHRYFPQFDTFEIKVDITALIKTADKAELCFVEVKTRPISLKDIG